MYFRKIVFGLIWLPMMLFSQPQSGVADKIPLLNGPVTEKATKFTFAIIGDKTGVKGDTWHIFDRAVEEINRLRPDFVLCTGDLIQGKVADQERLVAMWNEYFRHLDRLEAPFYMMAGNHDITNEFMYDYWTTHFGRTYYHFLYKNSLFIILSSEEHQKTKDGQLGQKQVAFIRSTLKANPHVDHIFLMAHKPLWEMDGAAGQEWQEISDLLKNRNCTVLAGHRHHLLYRKMNGQRHMVLSSTGGSLVPRAIDEMGKFYHYTLVTVEPDTATIAVIKPGNILAENIAQPDFTEKFSEILKIDTRLDLQAGSDLVLAGAEIWVANPLDENLEVELKILNEGDEAWHFDRLKINDVVTPGSGFEYHFTGTAAMKALSVIPQISGTIKYRGETVIGQSESFFPDKKRTRKFPETVHVSGPIDLKSKRRPADETDLTENFGEIIPLQKINSNISVKNDWRELAVQNGRIHLSDIFSLRDFAYGFIKFSISSPDNRRVFAELRPDNACQVYVNEELVHAGYPLLGVPEKPYVIVLPLKKGTNPLVLKSINYPADWYVDFWLIDNAGELKIF